VKDQVTREARHAVVARTGATAVGPLPGRPVVLPTRLQDVYILDLDGTIYADEAHGALSHPTG
jgi:hypothetical protein